MNLEESKVGEEGGSFEMGPGEGADPQGGPWPQGQQPGHLTESQLRPQGACCSGGELFQAAQDQHVIYQQVQLQVNSLALVKVHLGRGGSAESSDCPSQTPSCPSL